MQYEKIILELMGRIQDLEEDMKNLKNRIEILENSEKRIESSNSESCLETEDIPGSSVSVPYKKTTDEMIVMCYEYGKKAYSEKDANIGLYADEVAEKIGMNRSSAFIYIYAVKYMLDGHIYKRAISTKALRTYFEAIVNDFGKEGLAKAIRSVREHVAYRRGCGHPVDSIEALCDEYEKRLRK